MMRELTTLHTSMSAGAKRDARKKSGAGVSGIGVGGGGHNVNSAPQGELSLFLGVSLI